MLPFIFRDVLLNKCIHPMLNFKFIQEFLIKLLSFMFDPFQIDFVTNNCSMYTSQASLPFVFDNILLMLGIHPFLKFQLHPSIFEKVMGNYVTQITFCDYVTKYVSKYTSPAYFPFVFYNELVMLYIHLMPKFQVHQSIFDKVMVIYV